MIKSLRTTRFINLKKVLKVCIGTVILFILVIYCAEHFTQISCQHFLSVELLSRHMRWNSVPRKVFNYTNGNPYTPIINHSGVCRNISFLIIVPSALNHLAARNSIRDTWGNYTRQNGGGLIFLLGDYGLGVKKGESIKNEDNTYGDIVQYNFIDTYKNLSVKSQTMMKWVIEFCPNVKAIVKADDDIFFNMDLLIKTINNINQTNIIMGKLARGWSPVRNLSKWFVTEKEFAGKVYPDFVTGPSYMFPPDVANPIYEISLNMTYLYLEDVFITGIVAEKAGVKRINCKGISDGNSFDNPCHYPRLICHHAHSPSDIIRLWNLVHNSSFICREKL